jgi:hypothetical protein
LIGKSLIRERGCKRNDSCPISCIMKVSKVGRIGLKIELDQEDYPLNQKYASIYGQMPMIYGEEQTWC